MKNKAIEAEIVDVSSEAIKKPPTENQEIWGNVPEEHEIVTGTIGVYIHRFSKPFTYEGKTVEKLTFDYESLTGNDMLEIEKEMQACKEFSVGAEVSKLHQCKLAAKAASHAKEVNGFSIGSDVIAAMPMKDFNKICNAGRDFLLDIG